MSHRPRKRFGQHFLHDPRVVAGILRAMDPRPGQTVVEIGPGLGALTLPLLERLGELHVVELDRDLVPELEARAAGRGRLHVHQADATRFDFAALAPPGGRIRVVGNLPYNVSTPLLFHLLDQLAAIEDMHLMLQKEVVQRMAASPGGKDYGRLSVMVQWRCAVEPLFHVGPGAFRPPPKVTSTVVRLVPHARPPFEVRDPALFARVVAAAFSQRRKTLRNALASLAPPERIAAAGLDPGDRPERVPPEGFARLANLLAEEAGTGAQKRERTPR